MPQAQKHPARPFTLIEVILCLISILFAFGMACRAVAVAMGGYALGALAGVLEHLLFGFIYFPMRVIPQAHIDWDGVAAFLVCLLLLTCFGHRFLAWIYGANPDPKTQSSAANLPSRWPWRWTLFLVATILVVFPLCIAMSLVYYQIGWLLSPGHQLIRADLTPWSTQVTMRVAGTGTLAMYPPVADSNKGPQDVIRSYFLLSPMTPVLLERLHIGFINRPDGCTYGELSVPRDPAELRRLGIAVQTYDNLRIESNHTPPDAAGTNTIEEWPSALRKIQDAATTQTGAEDGVGRAAGASPAGLPKQ